MTFEKGNKINLGKRMSEETGGKNPDFINTNGEKKLIEYAGRYWHTGEEMDKRTELFAKYGFKTLIIWDNEFLKNPEKTIEVVARW